jgi:hypothetical protein
MDDTKKIDYIIRAETNEENHSMIEKLTKELVKIIKLNELEIEYFKHWYIDPNNSN